MSTASGNDILQHAPPPRRPPSRLRQFFSDYAWIIVKNLIGWLLIVLAGPIGIALPGPGGIPLFLIGFALITFPGKRKLTARILRGKGYDLCAWGLRCAAAALAAGVPIAATWWLLRHIDWAADYVHRNKLLFAGTFIAAVVITWIAARLGFTLMNWAVRLAPRARRRVRPWMRRRGIDLLPPRRRRRLRIGRRQQLTEDPSEIIEIHERHGQRMRNIFLASKPWLKRITGAVLIVAIFSWMFRPIVREWPSVHKHLQQTNIWTFVLASAMFTLFLFFRALVWRRIVKGFGYRIPAAAAVRIWITSELARYVPGSVMQFAGRVFLAAPYGVPRGTCLTSQILELSAFLLANVIIAVASLLWFAAKMEASAQRWFYLAMALVPVLALALHPKFFYGMANWVRGRQKKPPITIRLRGKILSAILIGFLVALCWQSVAIWLLTREALHLKLAWWWYIAGAYCLAWCAGFLSFLSPGGLGVRELVFYWTLRAILPPHIKDLFSPNHRELHTYLKFLGVLLRMWTIVGELALWLIAMALDYRGAAGRKDAPGRAPDASADSIDGAELHRRIPISEE
ncbi:MAG TPA: lysylphosphatidylglycerol synthase transmembrane domain-containing protein [Tepidisphaeraceae bacterium]|jgi:uncharacterized membrane protein YbhN (UPF0104 family)